MVDKNNSISNIYVPGGEYCDVPGTNLESGYWALAVGMANDRNNRQSIKALPDGIAGQYFTILKSIYEGFGWASTEPYFPMEESHLAAIIDYWNDHHRDKYRLIQDEGEPRAWTKVMNHKSRTVLVRSVRCRWQPCGYFERSETIKGPSVSVESRLAVRRTDAASTLTKPQSIPQLQVQTDTEEPAKEIIETATTIKSTATKLHTTCAKLAPAVEKPTKSLDKYGQKEGALQTAIDKLTATVEEAVLAEHQPPPRATPHDTTR
ncbi:MAG: Acetyl-CoA synthetase-like protein [Aureobasidium pullulans]|nr:MAG: Acetyl-CoA synthetase-like protein [Aureobasidium pullulans]